MFNIMSMNKSFNLLDRQFLFGFSSSKINIYCSLKYECDIFNIEIEVFIHVHQIVNFKN